MAVADVGDVIDGVEVDTAVFVVQILPIPAHNLQWFIISQTEGGAEVLAAGGQVRG